MRIPLTDDALRQLVYGLYEPTEVAHNVTYDRIGLSFSLGGIPVATQLKRIDSQASGGYRVEERVFPSFTGPANPEEDEPLRTRTISPTEHDADRYLYYAMKTTLKAVQTLDQSYEYQTYKHSDGGRQTHRSNERAFPGTGTVYDSIEDAVSYGFDVSGVMFWAVPVLQQHGVNGTVRVNRYGVTKTSPEVIFSGEESPYDEPFIAILDRPANMASSLRHLPQTTELYVSAVTVDDMDSEGQASLSSFVNESDELEFNSTHDALV